MEDRLVLQLIKIKATISYSKEAFLTPCCSLIVFFFFYTQKRQSSRSPITNSPISWHARVVKSKIGRLNCFHTDSVTEGFA